MASQKKKQKKSFVANESMRTSNIMWPVVSTEITWKELLEVNGHCKPRSKLNCIYKTIAEDLSFLCKPNHFSSKAIICLL